ncbi:cytochrome P450 [Citricoccus muralis]|uniref:Cytochrome P450 n=1 Tax=Citricoccus muralis TaxID=169134 RepID=A0ABY8H910_9MICC|nr:cytochrome P450 [Citricoccus muralis]WFP17097.1 cytochrome P450 [Citricoccus muralis]
MSTVHEDAAVADLPVADWLNPAEMARDPFPTYRKLRSESPVFWAPAINKVIFSTYAGCGYVEDHPEIFSSHVEGAAMVKAMGGRPLIRKDDPHHATERRPMNRPLRPKNIMEAWSDMFAENTNHYLDVLDEVGPGADLNHDFAAPLAAKNLISMLGMHPVEPDDMARWSADFIAGSGNVLDDADIWRRCDQSRDECHEALDETISRLRRQPDSSITSAMLEGGLPEESVRLNVMLTISGGINEPQHMITNSVHELSHHPEVLAEALHDESVWNKIFTECARKYTPIGMITRETIADGEFDGFRIPSGLQVGAILASANRDENQFSDPDRFSVHRSEGTHFAFGRGVHQCAGKWAAQESIGRIAVPALYDRFPNLTQAPGRPEEWDGWVFRGITSMPVTW